MITLYFSVFARVLTRLWQYPWRNHKQERESVRSSWFQSYPFRQQRLVKGLVKSHKSLRGTRAACSPLDIRVPDRCFSDSYTNSQHISNDILSTGRLRGSYLRKLCIDSSILYFGMVWKVSRLLSGHLSGICMEVHAESSVERTLHKTSSACRMASDRVIFFSFQ